MGDNNSIVISSDPAPEDSNINFDENEIEKLVEHFRENNMTQFYMVIIGKCMKNKTYSLEKDKLIPGLINLLENTKHDFAINSDVDIVFFAKILFQTIFSIDIHEANSTEF